MNRLVDLNEYVSYLFSRIGISTITVEDLAEYTKEFLKLKGVDDKYD